MQFPLEEYQERLGRVQAGMRANGLSGLLLHQPENIQYLTGFATSGYFMYHAMVVPPAGPPALVIRGMEAPAAAESAWVEQIHGYPDTQDPAECVRTVLRRLGLDGDRIGLDHHSWFLTIDRLNALKRLLPDATFVREPQIVDHVRLIKSQREIEVLRQASRFVEAGIAAGIDAIAADASEQDLATAIFGALIRSGSEPPLYGAITSGERTSQIHGQWSARRLREGDQVYLEMCGVRHGYFSKMMRTAIVGSPSADQARTADILLRAQDDAIARMRPGAAASDIDRACREPVLRAGLRETYGNRVGYSTGLTYKPSAGEFLREFVPGCAWTLEAGMVFHMLLMARGIGFSDTVLVTERGSELLTCMRRELVAR